MKVLIFLLARCRRLLCSSRQRSRTLHIRGGGECGAGRPATGPRYRACRWCRESRDLATEPDARSAGLQARDLGYLV